MRSTSRVVEPAFNKTVSFSSPGSSSNLILLALLKQAGVPYIIARATTELHHRVLKQVGDNEILDIEKTAGRQLAEKVLSPGILDSVPITMEISIAEAYLPESFAGKSLAEIDLPGKMNLTVSAVKRGRITIDEEGNPVSNERVVFPTPGGPRIIICLIKSPLKSIKK